MERLWVEVGDGFLKKVIVFRFEMVVYGKYKEFCFDCLELVQWIVYVENECNYCVVCQIGGWFFVDWVFLWLLCKDWLKIVQEFEE